MMILRWFCSRTVRQAVDLRKHVWRLTQAQRDLLSPRAVEALAVAAVPLQTALQTGAGRDVLHTRMTELEAAANRWLKPYPHANYRENVEVILVAAVVALAIRTFFLQPMKIPTGSMQPTLYGVTAYNLENQPAADWPSPLARWMEAWLYGTSYYHVVAKSEGELREIEAPRRVLPFIKKQRFLVGDTWYTIWLPPANLPARGLVPADQLLFVHAHLQAGRIYHAGEDLIKLKVVTGDHLFVNRMTYNFRHPQRGEIVIFETRGINKLPADTYYIKRLVALGNDRVRIGNDQHLIINGQRLDANTPHFENIYNFAPEPKEYAYFGHVNGLIGERFHSPGMAELFPGETREFTVRSNHFLVMGDNTMNSYDSRYWGDFPQEKVIGKAGFIYWPLSSRFGWAYR